MINGGYWGKLIEVDLSAGSVNIRPLPSEEVLRTWIGGAGLGLYLLSQEVKPEMKSTDPEAPIFVMTGPLTGTKAPSSSNWTQITLHDGVPYAPCISHGHGHFGARLKHAGYDGIIIRGASAEPVYLSIDDDTVELRKADKYWGMDTYETTRKIQIDMQDMERVSVACIGPAGEELMAGSSVRIDRAYGCSRGGVGVAWGSKKLKAIAVRGTKNVPIHNYEQFIETCEEWREKVKSNIGVLGWLDEAGGIGFMPGLAQAGAVQAKNYLDKEFQVKWGEKFAEDSKQWKIKGEGSWECDIKCHYDTLVTTGPHAGTRCIGYGAECMQDAATILGIEDPGTCLVMANFYDAMGCDPAVTGHKIAMAFEMYNKGLLTEEDTGGLKLEWGNDEAARELFMQILYRQEPLGRILAKTYKEAIRELGKGSEDMFVHVKGVGPNSHDLIGLGLGTLFQAMVSGNGPNLQGTGFEAGPDPDLGYTGYSDGAAHEGKALETFVSQVKKMWDDCTGVCWFVSLGCPGITQYLPRAVSLATGLDINWEDAKLVGERVINLQRLYALKRGFTKENDLDASARLLGPIESGPAKGRDLKSHLNEMLNDYYTFCGWDPETGIPKQETLKRLGLEDLK